MAFEGFFFPEESTILCGFISYLRSPLGHL
jgi:hypothetical protein